MNKKIIYLYIVIISMIALAAGFGDTILSNYFKDVYDITAEQRGFLEFPRELPGILSIFIIAGLSRFGDIKMTIVAQIFAMIGIVMLGVTTPSFYVMTIFLFIFSTGVHIYLPLQDSLAISILPEENLGKNLGKIKGVTTFVTLFASLIVFVGFKNGFFTFNTEFRWIFVLAGICYFISIILLIKLSNQAKNRPFVPTKLVFHKKYIYYYILAIMNGVQKQIVLVYSPWVLIEILEKGADTMSLLIIISSLLGMFFLPFLGKCIDKFGIRKMLYADAISFIFVYLSFAYVTYNIYVGNFLKSGIAVFVVYFIFIIDRMSSQMGIIRTIYLNTIATDKAEVLPTLSLGIALDHVVAILCAYVSGVIWMKYGPHYIFIIAASFSIINLVIAKIVPLNKGE